MAEKIHWGILGCGNIARKFAEGLSVVGDAELVAVGSRRQDKAQAFADEFGTARTTQATQATQATRATQAHGSYEALVADDEVEVVYVATPHALHKDHARLCLEAGKAVLCEKPFAINAAQARQVIDLARKKGLFLMEAMWTRFLPCLVRVRELLADGAIGQVRMVAADFGYRADFNPESRIFDPALGGGALLDVGVYPVSLASMVFGDEPLEIRGLAQLGATGVDEQSAFVLKYPGGRLANLLAAVRTFTPMEATIMGTEGHIRLHTAWWRGSKMTLCVRGREERLIELHPAGNGYDCEAQEVGRCLRAGRTESEVMPLDETLAVMRTLDRIRAEWGLTYPME